MGPAACTVQGHLSTTPRTSAQAGPEPLSLGGLEKLLTELGVVLRDAVVDHGDRRVTTLQGPAQGGPGCHPGKSPGPGPPRGGPPPYPSFGVFGLDGSQAGPST